MASKEQELAIKIKGKCDSSVNSALSQVTGGIQKAGQVIGKVTMAAAAAVGAIAVAAVNVGKEFESSMSSLSATAGLDLATAQGQADYEKLETAAREMGQATTKTASEAAEALNYMALAGWDVDTSISALEPVLRLSEATELDLATTSDLVTDSMSAMGVSIDDLSGYLDVCAAASTSSNQTTEDLMEALIRCGGAAKNAGMDYTETATALGILANNGIKGEKAGTALNSMLVRISTNSTAQKAFEDLGVAVYDDTGTMRDLQDILVDTGAAMEGMTDAEKQSAAASIAGKNYYSDFLYLLEGATETVDENGTAWDNLTACLEGSQGALEAMAETKTDNLEGDISRLTSLTQELGLKIYDDLQEPMRDVVQTATDMMGQLNDAYAEGGLEGMLTEVGNVVSELATMLADAVPGMVQTGMELIGSFVEGIGQSAPQLATAAMETVNSFISGLGTLLPQLITAGVQLVTSLLEGVAQGLPQLIMSGLEMINGLVQGIVQNIPVLIQSGVQIIVSLIQGISSNIGNIAQTAIEIILALVNGLISAIPYLIAAVPQIVGALVDAILNTDWISIGVEIITSIGTGIMDAVGNLGSTIMGAITGLFGGGEADSSAQSSGQAVSNSYAAGIEANTSAVSAATDSLTGSAFANVDTSAADAAGQETATAYTTGMDEALTGYEFDTSAIGLDSEALSEEMSQAAQESGTAFTEGLDTSISEYTFDTSAIGVDTEALSATMTEAGTAGGESLTEGLNAAVAGATVDTSAIAVDPSGIVASMQEAGVEGANALATGIQSGGASATSAAQSIMQAVSQAFTSGWATVQSQSSQAMSSLTSTVRSGAQTAANAVKSAFANMSIKIPKPSIPVISVSYRTESYGEGGSVKIPSFSVSWHALGGIFDDPTIFNSAHGLQGVGEAGPEAITPLDEMWTQIREIMTDVLRENNGTGVFESALNKLDSVTSSGGGTGQAYEEMGGQTITYAPVYNLNGTATTEDAVNAERISQEEFAKLMKQYNKQNARTKI